MIKVAKFGGSSVANAEQFKKVKEIILADPQRKYIVVSAIGKCEQYPEKMTDLLIQWYHQPDNDAIFQKIKHRFLEIKNECQLSYDIETELEKVKENLHHFMTYDELISRGEYFTAKLMAEYINYPFVDAKDVIQFQENSIDLIKTEENIHTIFKAYPACVMPGFYGVNHNHEIQLMKRGGSDISGAVLASFLDAKLYENWTDVSGFYMADPHLIHNPKKIQSITYPELKELSHRGANVLHEEAIFPVREKNIPIRILNTNRPCDCGTLIENRPLLDSYSSICGIAGNTDYSILHIDQLEKENSMDLLQNSVRILQKHHISIENIPAEINDFSLVIRSKNKESAIALAIDEIYDTCLVKRVKWIKDVALISIVGHHFMHHSKILGNIFYGLGNQDIDVKIISKGNEDMSLLIGIDSKRLNQAVETIYNTLK